MAKILAVANQKGGVGKTTTAVNLAACFAVSERRTLLVDLDPQGNATSAYGLGVDSTQPQVYDALVDACSLTDAAVPTSLDYLQIVPAGQDLVGAEIELVTLERRERRLADALAKVRDRFDVVLVDCPPSLGILTLNALTAADGVVIPLQCEYYALEGLARLLDNIERVRLHLNPRLALEGIVLTMVDARNNLARQVESEVRTHFGDKVFDTVIPRNVRLSEAPSHGMPILLYDVHSRGAIAYLRLAEEMLRRLEGTAPASATDPQDAPAGEPGAAADPWPGGSDGSTT